MARRAASVAAVSGDAGKPCPLAGAPSETAGSVGAFACAVSVAVSFKMVACVMSVAPAGADRTGPGAAAARRGTLRCSAAVSVSVESLVYTVKEALGLTFSRSRHSPDALVRASSRPLTDGAAAA
ncbi:Uncharacterised protein [Burkholderia pseudomallei]|nr:hypothetical protein AQ911_21765 [Burkholderia pseudomallei]CAJ5191067.1 Uncharacterised protein [Burkholderia pseudomallei]CAJ5193358.1 Uncharacterised protein [Burkholderia pseudomallei]CAJ5204441.1 Uncharacterised protein [Burkholderia pseudomallei]CAJ5215466.1 Uncharacterised protein [Burkholderia pseudomallei]